MIKHYVIAAHRLPGQLERMIHRLDDGRSRFWVHLDAAANCDDFSFLDSIASVRRIEPRINVVWADISQVDVILAGLRSALTSGEEGYVVYLSGQDYPIRTAEEIDAYLESAKNVVHLRMGPARDVWPDQYKSRFEDYYFRGRGKERRSYEIVEPRPVMSIRERFGWTRRLVASLGPVRGLMASQRMGRFRTPVFSQLWGGGSWFGFPWSVVVELIRVLDSRPEVRDWFRHTICSDESMIHSVFAECVAPGRDIELRDQLTYTDWTEGEESPRVLGVEDLPELMSLPENYLFARKLDSSADRSNDLLRALDARIQGEVR